MYEQIYALAGPTMTYRLTGDPEILHDIKQTVKLFEKFFRDERGGGYFSHLDPISLDPRAASLAHNRAKKNWNSVGDHAPAYLINLFLATGEAGYADFLEETFDTIVRYFPDEPTARSSTSASTKTGRTTKPGAGSRTAPSSATT